MFEQATRKKFRFNLSTKNASVEDLWDLELEVLNKIAKNLNREIKASKEEDFIGQTVDITHDEERFNIVLHIIKTKLAERKQTEEDKEKTQARNRILSIIKAKQEQSLLELSVEELQAKLKEYD